MAHGIPAAGALMLLPPVDLQDRAHLDGATRGTWEVGGQLNGLIQVGAVNDIEPAELLLRLARRTARRS